MSVMWGVSIDGCWMPAMLILYSWRHETLRGCFIYNTQLCTVDQKLNRTQLQNSAIAVHWLASDDGLYLEMPKMESGRKGLVKQMGECRGVASTTTIWKTILSSDDTMTMSKF